MGNYTYVKDYKNNDRLRLSFNKLAGDTFGMSFENWYQKGYWNENYVCHSLEYDGEIVSNISINHMKFKLNGEEVKAIQVGTVMTDKLFRRKGLAQKLMEIVVKEYEDKCDFMYLFGNDFARKFYTDSGFLPVGGEKICSMMIEAPVQAEKCDEGGVGDEVIDRVDKFKLRKLDLSNTDDYKILETLVNCRGYASEKLGVKGDSHLLWFYITLGYDEDIYYCDRLNTVVIMNQDEKILKVHDILCDQKIDAEDFIKGIVSEDIEEVVFGFTPDINKEKLSFKELKEEDSTLLVRQNKEMVRDLDAMFPVFSHA